MSKVGCRPYWLDYIQTDLKDCSEAQKLEEYLLHIHKTNYIDEEELMETYHCLKPCKYMEYKVKIGRYFKSWQLFDRLLRNRWHGPSMNTMQQESGFHFLTPKLQWTSRNGLTRLHPLWRTMGGCWDFLSDLIFSWYGILLSWCAKK